MNQGDTTAYSGAIYIGWNRGSGGRRIYKASIVGTGLHLDPDRENEGGTYS